MMMMFGCRESTGAHGGLQILLAARESNGVRMIEIFQAREL